MPNTKKENNKNTIKPTETQGLCPGKVSVSVPLLQAPIFMSMLPDGPASKGAARDDAMRQPQLTAHEQTPRSHSHEGIPIPHIGT